MKRLIMKLNAMKTDSITQFARKVAAFLSVKKWTLVACFLFIPSAYAADNAAVIMSDAQGPNWQYFSNLNQAGFVLRDSQNNLLEDKNAQRFYVPASTTKLITALLAIEHWGLEHHFHTDFYLRKNKDNGIVLVVKGYGDPFLVSEELVSLAQKIKNELGKQGVSKLYGIEIDGSYYQSNLIMPGTSQSLNPYDAIPSAIAANFNTINAVKKGKSVLSAEKQTPMVETGQKIVKGSSLYKKQRDGKKFRINLGDDVMLTQRYFAELLAAFLEQQNLKLNDNFSIGWSQVAQSDELLYRHYNSRSLADVIKPMMKYSTNFIANQLALNLSAELQGKQASRAMVEKTYSSLLKKRFGWQDFLIEDGAGLSRKNRLAPNQLIDVLEAFKSWIELLPEVERHVYAKSGSLIGVSTLAGYIEQNGQLLPFAMMINQKVPYRFRNKLAKELAQKYNQ